MNRQPQIPVNLSDDEMLLLQTLLLTEMVDLRQRQMEMHLKGRSSQASNDALGRMKSLLDKLTDAQDTLRREMSRRNTR